MHKLIKSLLLVFFCVAAVSAVSAAPTGVPSIINIQGIISPEPDVRTGELLVNIYESRNGAEGGVPLMPVRAYPLNEVMSSGGVFNVNVDVSPITFIGGYDYYVEIGLQSSRPAADDVPMAARGSDRLFFTPRQHLVSVPFAITAKNVYGGTGFLYAGRGKRQALFVETEEGAKGIRSESSSIAIQGFGSTGGSFEGSSGPGVYGNSTRNIGVVGYSHAPGMAGVFGVADASNGVFGRSRIGGSAGVQGSNDEPGGIGVRGDTMAVDGGSAVLGYSDSVRSPAVWGESTVYNGVGGRGHGDGNSGIWGANHDPGGIGVSGTGETIGVLGSGGETGVSGRARSGAGVAGSSTNGDGVSGAANVAGRSGVYGSNPNGNGVSGRSTSDTGVWGEGGRFGAYFNSPSGIGMFASSIAAGDTTSPVKISTFYRPLIENNEALRARGLFYFWQEVFRLSNPDEEIYGVMIMYGGPSVGFSGASPLSNTNIRVDSVTRNPKAVYVLNDTETNWSIQGVVIYGPRK